MSQKGIVISADMQELPGLHRAPLPGDFVLFHEAGDVFAQASKLSGPGFINELAAESVSAAYIIAG